MAERLRGNRHCPPKHYTGHPGSISTLHSDSPRETLPRLVRLALRSPHAPRSEAVVSEVARTVDLVLHLGAVSEGGVRLRRLDSIGYVAAVEAGQPLVDELVRRVPGRGLVRVASPASLPERALAKLSAAGDLGSLLEGVDA